MTSRKKAAKWRIVWRNGRSYTVSDGARMKVIDAHCSACALSDAISRFGGDADLRGMWRCGRCYDFLVVLVIVARMEQTDE